MNLYLSDGKAKCGEKNGTANDPKQYSLIHFTDDLMYDDE